MSVGDLWREGAACKGAPIEWFYEAPGAPAGVHPEGKALCDRCPVAAECRQYARARPEPGGLWGGEGEQDRNKGRADRVVKCSYCPREVRGGARSGQRVCCGAVECRRRHNRERSQRSRGAA